MRPSNRSRTRAATLAVAVLFVALPVAHAGAQTDVVAPFSLGGALLGTDIGPVDVAAGSDGRFLVVWEEHRSPYSYDSRKAVSRLASEAGFPLGPARRVDSSSRVFGPLVGATASGYVAGWNWIVTGTDYAFFGVHMDAAGAARGRDFRVTLPINSNTVFGTSVGLPSGPAFVWDQSGLWGRILDLEGNLVGGDFLISSTQSGIWRNRAAPTGEGGLVATWLSFYEDPPDALWARIYGPDGQPRTAQFLVTDRGLTGLRAAASPTGTIAVLTVLDEGEPGAPEIRAHYFDASGAPLTAFVAHSTDSTVPYISGIDAEFDDRGSLWLVWSESSGGRWTIRGRVFDPAGNPAGPAVDITSRISSSVSTARLSSGRFVNVWRDHVGGDVRANVVELCGPGVTDCGDGVVSGGCEQCDAGAANSDTLPDACRTDCTIARCGDGTVDSAEQFDDGNVASCDGCSATCALEAGALCGDGVRNAACGEECDAGDANGAPGGCRAECRFPSCGDGRLDPGEECDDGNTATCDGCGFRCEIELTPPALCGPTHLAGLTSDQLARFESGRRAFVQVRRAETGLGPVFNGESCATCHLAPTVGGASDQAVTRIGRPGASGIGFDPLVELGGSLLQANGIETDGCTVAGEVVPAAATLVSRRSTPPLFGLGLIDAVRTEEIARRADPTDDNRDGISGRVASLGVGQVGRFGWKAQIATLHDFSADAYRDEMGITTPFRPTKAPRRGSRSRATRHRTPRTTAATSCASRSSCVSSHPSSRLRSILLRSWAVPPSAVRGATPAIASSSRWTWRPWRA
ncbi:MAG: hypothetical protein FJ148_11230 [Deltaproteobacteria bacterium]|nr:hypothetical protein [Deltaproteobacteria bacterium]